VCVCVCGIVDSSMACAQVRSESFTPRYHTIVTGSKWYCAQMIMPKIAKVDKDGNL